MSAASTPLRDVDDAPPRERAKPQGMALPFDVVLVLGVIGLAICSLVAIKSSTADDIKGDPTYYFERQLIFFCVGGVLSLALVKLDYSRLRPARWWIYGFLMFSIIAVKLIGVTAKGSQRSIAFGPFQYQASESARS